jgi:citrate lyase beta subunit
MSTSSWVTYSGYVCIGLGVVVCGLLAWVAVLQVRFSRLYRQYTRVMTGTDGTSLEQSLNQHMDAVKQAVEKASALEIKTRQMDRTLKHSMQWMGIVRFNPFRDTGGAQSFALAIVDGHGDGVVLSSLHSRENTRVYAKPLNKWESEHTLTDEEKQAIARAYRQQV